MLLFIDHPYLQWVQFYHYNLCAQFVQINRNQHRTMILGSFPIFQTQSYCQTLFSQILIAKSIEKDTEIIIKKNKTSEATHLKKQLEILTKMQSHEGFPRIYSSQFEDEEDLPSIQIQKLGLSLKTLIYSSNAKNIEIPIFSIVNLAFQMLDRIEKLHMNGYIHNDLKPDHFLFQTNDPSSPLFLIDFGLSVGIDRIQCQKQSHSSQAIRFRGNIAYSSVNKMKCKKESIRDDLESLVYIIGQMLEGQLPWKPKHRNWSEAKNWKATFSAVLSKKLQNHGWKKFGSWINQTLGKIRKEEDPYRLLRKSIGFLLELEC